MKKFTYWLLAIVITLVLSVYQRITGPTQPKYITVELNGENYKQKLPRSGVQQDEVVKLKGLPADVKAQLHYRCCPTSDEYSTIEFVWQDSILQAALPVQPVAGKLQYYITVSGQDYAADEPIVIRFRNDVPAAILVPHILLMFASMLFAIYTLLLTVTRKGYRKWLKTTVITLFIGGFVFGPLVQHAAFGHWWTGFPFGTDLTDNKTLLSFFVFAAALATLKWKHNLWVVVVAVLFMVAIFCVPHSAFGSEYDYEKQELSTAK